MRTFGIILAMIAVLALALVLIAPNLELDDYSDQPFHDLVALLAAFLLPLLSVYGCFHLLNIGVQRWQALMLRDLWLPSTPVITAPVPLLC